MAVADVVPGVALRMEDSNQITSGQIASGQIASGMRPSPPKVPFALGLGVTGHRSDLLDGSIALIERRMDAVVVEILAAARRIASEGAGYFADRAARFSLVSQLAEGADQIAARTALDHGIELHVVLPFERAEYERDFAGEEARERFAGLVARADRLLELPGHREAALQAYLMAGRATVAHCDLLIAVWDGKPPRGRGGTGEVVEIALLAGTPIVHIPVNADEPISLLWSAFDPHVHTNRQNSHTASRPYSTAALDAVLKALLDPPADPVERGFLAAYYRERERRLNPRVEYPLMLALTGIAKLRRADFRTRPFAAAIAENWAEFRERCAGSTGVTAGIDPLQSAYCWSDLLARHFAQTYRSGHIFNFLLGAVAVLIALSGLLFPAGKLGLAIAELAVIGSVIVNTRVGVNHGWHRRWLDYRNLAERLRPMRSLKLVGIAAPQRDAAARNVRWIDWYAARMWRALGLPEGKITDPAMLAAALVAHELDPQIAYHRAAAASAERLDHRLHLIGTALFSATIVSCIALIAGHLAAPGWIGRHAMIFVVLSAGLPAFGTAIFGIRMQGDFAGTSLRSHATAERLAAIASQVDPEVDLARAADLFERGAEAMLADLGEWRLAHLQRELVIP